MRKCQRKFKLAVKQREMSLEWLLSDWLRRLSRTSLPRNAFSVIYTHTHTEEHMLLSHEYTHTHTHLISHSLTDKHSPSLLHMAFFVEAKGAIHVNWCYCSRLLIHTFTAEDDVAVTHQGDRSGGGVVGGSSHTMSCLPLCDSGVPWHLQFSSLCWVTARSKWSIRPHGFFCSPDNGKSLNSVSVHTDWYLQKFVLFCPHENSVLGVGVQKVPWWNHDVIARLL